MNLELIVNEKVNMQYKLKKLKFKSFLYFESDGWKY
jgi:hypothetical protein